MRFRLAFCLFIVATRVSALELDGHTDFAERLVLNSGVSGYVDSIEAKPGQAVSSGQILLRLDPTGLEANVDIASAEVDALTPALARMQTELDKAQELFDRDSLALVELQNAEQDHAVAAARLAAAEARLRRAQYRLAQAEIRSPIDGVVIRVEAFTGQFINTRVSDPGLIMLADRRRMVASALLPLERFSENLRNRKARISFRDRQYDGRVVDISSRITTGDNNHPALTLVVEFATDGGLPAGLPVKISINDQ